MRSFLYTLVTTSALSPLIAAHMEVIKRPLALSSHLLVFDQMFL